MKRWIMLLLCGVLLSGLAPMGGLAASAQSSTNLLTNGGFEVTETRSGWKDNVAPAATDSWRASGSPVFAVDTEVARSGSHSASVEAESPSRGAVIVETRAIEIGATYRISGWMKTDNVSGKALVRVQAGRTGGNILINIVEKRGTNDWTYFERVLTIPDNAASPPWLKIEAFLENSSGKVWFDDFAVEEYVELEGIALEDTHMELDSGAEAVLTPQLTPANATNQQVQWESSAPHVVEVSGTGQLRALKEGYSIITVTAKENGLTAATVVSVDARESLAVVSLNEMVQQNGGLSGQLIANDAQGAPIVFSKVMDPLHGTANVRSDGTFTYYPDRGYSGKDRFVFIADAGNGGPRTGVVELEVVPAAEAPELDLVWHTTPKNQSYSGKIESVLMPEPEKVLWTRLTEPRYGQATVEADGSFTYTPNAGYIGYDEFRVAASTAEGQVTEDVVKIYAAPIAGDFVDKFAQEVEEGSHPRLLATADDFAYIRGLIGTDPYVTEWYDLLRQRADPVLNTLPLPYAPNGSNYSVIRSRLVPAALMYQLSGETKYAERVVLELEALSEYPDWGDRHNNMLPMAELTFAVALAYDWVYEYMSPAQRSMAADAIADKALAVALDWYNGEFRHNGEYNNINLVDNGSFAVAALAVLDERGPVQESASRVLQGAYHKLQQALRHYTPDGTWPEGPAYWHYGGQYLTYMMAAMNNVLKTDYGLSSMPGIRESGAFPVYLLGEGGFFNFYDGGITMAQPESMWFASFFDQPELAWHLGDLYRRKGVFDPLYLVLYRPGMFDVPPTELDRTFSGIEAISMRSAWNDPNALFVSMKGFNETLLSHHDLDSGSFVMDALGVRWALDVGNESYSLPGFWDYNRNRWQYYRKTAEGHNTLVINPQKNPVLQQDHKAKALLEKSEFKPRGGYGILDMTDRYPADAVSLKRGLMLTGDRKELILQDEMVLKSPSEIYWFMHTTADIEIIGNGQAAILREKDKQLYVKLLEAPTGASFSAMDAVPLPSSPNPPGQSVNYGVKKLAVHMTDVEAGTLSVWMVPLNGHEPLPSHAPAVHPLTDWTIPDGELPETPAPPLLDSLTVNGVLVDGFDPQRTFYEVALPFDELELPVVDAHSRYPVTIIPATGIPGRAFVDVTDPRDPAAVNRYTVSFRTGPIIGDLPEVNRLPVAAVTASAVPEAAQGNTPDKTLDGNLDTRWSADGEQWIQYDLGASTEVGAVSIAIFNGNSRTQYFDIHVSQDGSEWTTVYPDGISSGLTVQPELYPFAPITARYIRINGYGNSATNWNSITETGIFRPSPLSIRLTVPQFWKAGDQLPLTSRWHYSDGRTEEASGTVYASDNPSVLEIDHQGIGRAKQPGEATLTVTDSVYGLQRSMAITVTEGEPSSLVIHGSPHMIQGGSQQLRAELLYPDGSKEAVSDARYESSAPHIVAVTDSGTAFARNAGEAIITVTEAVYPMESEFRIQVTAKPGGPGEGPEEPGEGPGGPGEGPEEPGEEPGGPGEGPEEPGEEPGGPGEGPEEPGEGPGGPGEGPEKPGAVPGQGRPSFGGPIAAPDKTVEEGTLVITSDQLTIQNKRFEIDLEGIHRVEWTADAVRKLDREAIIWLRSAHFQLKLTGGLLHDQLDELELGDQDRARIIFSYLPVEQELLDRWLSLAEQVHQVRLKPQGDFIELKLEAVSENGTAVSLPWFTEPVYLLWSPDVTAYSPLLGFYRLDDGGQLEYAAGKFNSSQNMWETELHRFSYYGWLVYEKTYLDVPAAHWANSAITRLSAKHVVEGTGAGRFEPKRAMNRAEFTALLTRAFQLDGAVPNGFEDVSAGDWFAPYVAAAQAAGLVTGMTDTEFRPYDPLTREQAAALAVRTYRWYGVEADSEEPQAFRDEDAISAWAKPYVKEAAQLGIMHGKSGGIFDPSEILTRAEGAQLVSNLLDASRGF
ncbi:S-layer homology domain-containing protein [Paenibacillus senegalensis]|uniref:S-layer homology domain-containing protein n=1 Tax=Paenibacillus senegalensis TaxID=1465766 RepID=UPI00028974E2|nr:S-layer homology domain-containing protein [Paenibacillus senegalensis]